MSVYRQNHYVPVWYQERFLPPEIKEQKSYYLDLKPDTVVSNGRPHKRAAVLRWGPKRCFKQQDLYTTRYGNWISTEIEEEFFGKVDAEARPALDYFANFTHPSAEADPFHQLMRYMSIQKLRTPKGLADLGERTRRVDKNHVLMALQELQQIFCSIWTECVWSIADASQSPTKLLLSDHPVTVYNQGCFPASDWCRNHRDPDIWLTGTHTVFPLTLDKVLILTNLSWARYPYSNPIKKRPNPNPFRPAMFNFTQIQTKRMLVEDEVVAINHIIKSRAHRYVAAADKAWLYPEEKIGARRWDKFGKDYLLMPDPRSMTFSDQILIGYGEGRGSDAFDAYGQRPGQPGFDDKARHEFEWEAFHAFQGEFARRFGRKRRGVSFEFMRPDKAEDTEDYHRYHLGLEQKCKKHRYK
jgi:uncharacterized protein DUF4238